MTDRVDRAVSIALTVACLTMAVTYVRREFSARAVPERSNSAGPPEYVTDWNEMIRNGIVVGDTNARFKVVEFADFECPFCRASDTVYRAVKRRVGAEVALVYVHFPLTTHRFALPAARAAECADAQNHFSEMHDVLFDKQDSLGLKSWESFATDAGLDTAQFAACMRVNTKSARIDAGRAAGTRLGVRGTPTVLLNGWRFSSPPSIDQLSGAIQDLRAGRKPGQAASPSR